MIKRKSRSKKNTNEKELKKNDLLEEIGTINGFAIIEKSSKDNEEDKKEKEETKKEEDLEMKGELIDLSNFDDKNKSFFKNWIVYDNPKESRFTKLFKELEVEDNKNDIYQINADTEQYQGETNSAFDNISRDPSEENSRDSRASYENFNIITEETKKTRETGGKHDEGIQDQRPVVQSQSNVCEGSNKEASY